MAVTLGSWFILSAMLPGIDPMVASLWIILAVSLLLLAGVTAARWWQQVGYTPVREWRDTAWLLVPAAVTLLPLVTGIKPLEAGTYGLLIAGYLLTGFAEETMFRGVLVKVLGHRSPMMIATTTAVLFGLVHLSNILIRGNGRDAWFGWPTAPRLEELRDAWLEAPDLAAQQRIARELQVVAMDELPCIPLGAIYRSTATSRTLRDRVTGFPIFWNIRRA